MIPVSRALLAELERLITEMEEKGAQAEDAAARLNSALADILWVATERSRLAHEAHKLLKRMRSETA